MLEVTKAGTREKYGVVGLQCNPETGAIYLINVHDARKKVDCLKPDEIEERILIGIQTEAISL